MGKKIVLTGVTLTDTSAPRLAVVDPIESDGSLLLIDPTHPISPWSSGVPSDGATVPNLLADTAATVTGQSAASMTPTFLKPAGFTGTAGLIERTGMGGLHGISPQSGAAVANTGPVLAFPTALVKYTLDHPDNAYFVSFWGRLTRHPVSALNNGAMLAFNSSSGQTNNYLALFAPHYTEASAWTIRPASGSRSGANEPANSAIGNVRISVGASQGWVGTLPDGAAAVGGGGIPFGSARTWTGIGTNGATFAGNLSTTCFPANKDLIDSHIVYRVYIEDLTVSGRTYAEVDAIDYALYTAQVLTAGGRYYGDTYTDPTTIP